MNISDIIAEAEKEDEHATKVISRGDPSLTAPPPDLVRDQPVVESDDDTKEIVSTAI